MRNKLCHSDTLNVTGHTIGLNTMCQLKQYLRGGEKAERACKAAGATGQESVKSTVLSLVKNIPRGPTPALRLTETQSGYTPQELLMPPPGGFFLYARKRCELEDTGAEL